MPASPADNGVALRLDGGRDADSRRHAQAVISFAETAGATLYLDQASGIATTR